MQPFPQFDLKGQAALVTGAARGLGRAIALALAHSGADVALGLRDLQAHGGLPEEIEALGRRVLPLQMDVTSLDQIRRAVDHAAAHFGRLDILVNNAGIAPGNPAEDVHEDDFDLTLRVNLKGTFFASQAAARIMIGQKSGRIVNMGSQAGFAALPGESVYCMTKAGISHLTKCLAVEWGKYGITVNAGRPPSSTRLGPRRLWPILPFAQMWWSASPRCIALASRWTWPARWCSWLHPRLR
jgi:NAD(P)-dependent dehydrogenase (short-subunit alcohol dehydrogenase family)